MKDERFIESKAVFNSRFGEGKVLKAKGDLIHVAFEGDITPSRMFRYPLCFKSGVLRFESPQVQQRILHNINKEALLKERLRAKRGQNKKKLRTTSFEKNLSFKPRTFTKEEYFEQASLNHYRDEKKIPHFKNAEEMMNSFQAALEEELSVSRSHGGQWHTLTGGVPLGKSKDTYSYRFYSPKILKIPPGSMINIQYGKHHGPGIIRSCDGHYVFMTSTRPLDGYLATIKIQNNPTILLEKLMESLQSPVYSYPNSLAHQLVFKGPEQITSIQNQSFGQESAIEHALTDPITFIWGPPGTGKTETIARICERMYNQGRKVLMLSFSNVAVDQAMLRILKKIPQASEGGIIRYGLPSLEEARNHPWLSSQAYALASYPEEMARKTFLEDEIRRLRRKKDPKSVLLHEEYTEELIALKEDLLEKEEEALHEAAITGATVAKALIDPSFIPHSYDAVIFDEASMAYIPYIFYAATLARKNFIICGDFNQLPPVVQSPSRNLLHFDIFQYAGIVDAIAQNKGHKWLQILDNQYRMHSSMSDFVSHLMYYDHLKTPEEQNKKLEPVVDALPFAGTPLVLADLSRMHSACYKHNGSKYNILSAFITCFLALQAEDPTQTGIISPYNQQIELIQAILEDLYGEGNENIPLASTVHRFQGSERQVMLLDLTDNYNRRAGPLISTKENDYSDRLINVALTRAKAKFVMVADREFVERNVNGHMMLRQLMNYSTWAGKTVRGESLIDQLKKIDHPNVSFYDDEEKMKAFFRDLRGAKESIQVFVAGQMVDTIQDLVEFGKILDEKEEEKISLDLLTRSLSYLSENLEDSFEAVNRFHNTMVIIDEKIIWMNMPKAQTEFQSGTRFLKTEFDPVFRFEGEKTGQLLSGLLMAKPDIVSEVESESGYIPYRNFADYVEKNFLCPNCGNPMVLRSSSSYNFISCSQYPACISTQEIKLSDVEAYLYEMRYCTNTLNFAYGDLKAFEDKKTNRIRIIDQKTGREYTLDTI